MLMMSENKYSTLKLNLVMHVRVRGTESTFKWQLRAEDIFK